MFPPKTYQTRVQILLSIYSKKVVNFEVFLYFSSFCQKVQKPHLYWFYSGLTTNQFCESAAKKVILSWRILMRFSNSVIEAFSFDKNFCYSYSRSRNHHLSRMPWHPKSVLNWLFSTEKKYICVGKKYNSDSQESSDSNMSNDTNVDNVYFCSVGDA